MADKLKKILIIEDSSDVRENLEELLSLSGYNTLAAENGKIGVRLALEHLPDLVLCDIMMPELDGYGVLHILSKHSETLHIPFIFLSAKADRIDVRKGMTLGADDYITKPYESTDLLNAIENRLKKSDFSGADTLKRERAFSDIFEQKLIKLYGSNELIYREGDTPYYLYYIAHGRVKIFKSNRDGKEAIMDLYGAGDFFGYWGLLQDATQTEAAEALSNTEIWLIPREDFLAKIRNNAEVSGTFLKLLSKNLLIKEQKLLELAYESVRKRVANALVAMCDIYGEGNLLKMKIPRELIAAMAGTSLETAIRMLSEFKSSELIAIRGSEIEILAYEKLKNAPF